MRVSQFPAPTESRNNAVVLWKGLQANLDDDKRRFHSLFFNCFAIWNALFYCLRKKSCPEVSNEQIEKCLMGATINQFVEPMFGIVPEFCSMYFWPKKQNPLRNGHYPWCPQYCLNEAVSLLTEFTLSLTLRLKNNDPFV